MHKVQKQRNRNKLKVVLALSTKRRAPTASCFYFDSLFFT